MGIARIVIGDHSIEIGSLPLQVAADVSRETGVPWTEIWSRPAWNADVALALLAHVAAMWGIEPPTVTLDTVTDFFRVDDEEDTPEGYEGGMPVVGRDGSPLEEGDPPTS